MANVDFRLVKDRVRTPEKESDQDKRIAMMLRSHAKMLDKADSLRKMYEDTAMEFEAYKKRVTQNNEA